MREKGRVPHASPGLPFRGELIPRLLGVLIMRRPPPPHPHPTPQSPHTDIFLLCASVHLTVSAGCQEFSPLPISFISADPRYQTLCKALHVNEDLPNKIVIIIITTTENINNNNFLCCLQVLATHFCLVASYSETFVCLYEDPYPLCWGVPGADYLFSLQLQFKSLD